MMKAAAVLLLLPLAVAAFSPLAGRTAKTSFVARNVMSSQWTFGEGDPEPEVSFKSLVESSRSPSTRHPDKFPWAVYSHAFSSFFIYFLTLRRLIPAVRIPMNDLP
jgi:hypothetical protein